jgi:hypothetical protein
MDLGNGNFNLKNKKEGHAKCTETKLKGVLKAEYVRLVKDGCVTQDIQHDLCYK